MTRRKGWEVEGVFCCHSARFGADVVMSNSCENGLPAAVRVAIKATQISGTKSQQRDGERVGKGGREVKL